MKKSYLLFLVGMIAAIAFRKISDPDVFWHLRVGELAGGSMVDLSKDPFSFTFQGQPWIYKDLIADKLLYLGFACLGFFWFPILKILAAVSICSALWIFVDKDKRSPLAFLFSAGLVLLAIGPRFLERPLLFSLAILPWFFVLGRRIIETSSSNRSWITLIGLQWVWALLHREAIFGLAFFVNIVLMHFILRKRVLPAIGFFFIAMLITLMTPSGFHIFESTFSVFQSPELREVIWEWRPPIFAEVISGNPGFVVMVTVTLISFFFVRPSIKKFPSQLMFFELWCILLILYSRSTRWMAFFSISSAFLLIPQLSKAWRESKITMIRGLPSLVGLSLFVSVLKLNPYPLGLGEAPSFPRAAMDFAERRGLHSSVINYYDFGGYIIQKQWPRFLVMFDGRADQIYPFSYLRRAMHSAFEEELFDSMLPELKADWVIASNRPGKISHGFLVRKPEWALVFWSKVATIYVKRSAYPELRSEFLTFLPLFLDSHKKISDVFNEVSKQPGGLQRLKNELTRMLEFNSDDIRLELWLAALDDRLGNKEESESRLRRLARDFSDDPVMKELKELPHDIY